MPPAPPDPPGPVQARRRLAPIPIAPPPPIVTAVTVDARPAHGANGRCPQYEGLLAAYGLPVATFSRIIRLNVPSVSNTWIRRLVRSAT